MVLVSLAILSTQVLGNVYCLVTLLWGGLLLINVYRTPLISFTKYCKFGQATHMATYLHVLRSRSSIRQAKMEECSRGFLVIGPAHTLEASRPKILSSKCLVAVPSGAQ